MNKLFRWHRGGLIESLETTIEVTDLDHIKSLVTYNIDSLNIKKSAADKIKIDNNPIYDDRLPADWTGVEYLVVAELESQDNELPKRIPLGYCNFIE